MKGLLGLFFFFVLLILGIVVMLTLIMGGSVGDGFVNFLDLIYQAIKGIVGFSF